MPKFFIEDGAFSALEQLINSARGRVVGTKQTMKALEKGNVVQVFIARDAEAKVVRPVLSFCRNNDVELHYVETMAELGKMCGIKVKAATAAITE